MDQLISMNLYVQLLLYTKTTLSHVSSSFKFMQQEVKWTNSALLNSTQQFSNIWNLSI